MTTDWILELERASHATLLSVGVVAVIWTAFVFRAARNIPQRLLLILCFSAQAAVIGAQVFLFWVWEAW